jgi:hypothetical protein
MDADTDRTIARAAMRFGLIVWGVIVLAARLGWFRIGLIEQLFLAAVWVVVPAGILMIPKFNASSHNLTRRRWIVFAAAAFATAGFRTEPGRLASALVIPWMVVCAFIACEGLRRIARCRLTSFSQFCFAAGEGYLLVGGVWLVMSRIGKHPAGFQEPIVLLTAVHFRFAGFLTGLLAGLAWKQHIPRGRTPLRTLIIGAILGPGMLGLAFLAGPKFKLVAVALIVVGQCAIAATMAGIGIRRLAQAQGWLLVASSGSLIAGMIFALTWAVGEYPLHSFVNLAQMEQIHGVLNAVGFGLIGLSAWVFFPIHTAQP